MHRHFTFAVLRVLSTALIAAASHAHAETITVCLDGSCDFTSPGAAVEAAAAGDTIEIAAGTYPFSAPIETFGKNVVIRGAAGADGRPTTIFDGQNSTTLLGFWYVSALTQVENVVLVNGHAEHTSALRVELSTGITFRNCVLRDNRSQFSGAMSLFNSNVTMIGCEVIDNVGYHPGQSAGAGIRLSPGTLTLIDCTVSGNSSTYSGGGIFMASQSVTNLQWTRVCGNSAPLGAQIGLNGPLGGTVNYLGGACVAQGCDDCPPAKGCPADLDGNAFVDGLDLADLLAAWGTCSKCSADIDGDGSVNGWDLGALLAAWGACE